jgi:sugar phosphate isomerase/epimerase
MQINRREFHATLGASSIMPAVTQAGTTRMLIHLSAGSIGVKANQLEAIEHAARHGYQAVDADSGYLASLETGALQELVGQLKAKNLQWGTSGLTVEFRKSDEEFRSTLKEFPRRVAALRSAGATRVTTWISPAHDSLTYLENFKQHAARLREAAAVLEGHGCRLGLEYVGPKTLWSSRRYAFVHSMKEMKELIAEIGKPNVGFVLDTWHWYTAGETVADLETLSNRDIVSVDLNDAPAGIPVEQQVDSRRELPCSTGVINTAAFLNTLNKLGCDAPVRCEPFNAALRSLAPELALAATVQAMRKAFALIQG